MGVFDKIRFKFWDPAGMVSSLVKEWHPVRCKTEKGYEKSLYSFLHKRLEDIQITKQYARGRIRADLLVGDKVIVEIKNNFNTTTKYQRLIGQITEYKEWEGEIIIVLMGKTDPNLRKGLENYAEKEEDGWGEKRIIIIQK